jgi:hypothetical protein
MHKEQHQRQHNLNSNSIIISKLAVVVLSIVLLTGISLVPALQIGVNGQVQKQQQLKQPNKLMEASGHFANNQIENGTVTWIQGGLWHLDIYNSTTSNPNNEANNVVNNNNYTADFSANFTMIKPDGSLSHEHMIKNFTSDNVILSENDIIVTGITDIYTNNNSTLEYKQIPITVHLMGKKVLGLMIDVKKTERHFASSNELFGTLISGTGLEDTELLLQDDKNNNNMKMDEMMTMPHS